MVQGILHWLCWVGIKQVAIFHNAFFFLSYFELKMKKKGQIDIISCLHHFSKHTNIYSEFLTGINEQNKMNLNTFLTELLGYNSATEYKDLIKTLMQWKQAESAFI